MRKICRLAKCCKIPRPLSCTLEQTKLHLKEAELAWDELKVNAPQHRMDFLRMQFKEGTDSGDTVTARRAKRLLLTKQQWEAAR